MDHMQSFGSLSLGSRLKRLSDSLIQDVNNLYKSQGVELNPTFFPLFNLLNQQGAITVTEAAEKLGVSHPAISKIARKMLLEGWLTKTADRTDERRQLLALTAKSDDLLITIEPVWREIKEYLDKLIASQEYPLLASLAEFEGLIERQGFYQPVVEQLERRRDSQKITVKGWDASLREDFKRLNLDWLNGYFNGELNELDREALDNPEGYYLSRGGYVWFAFSEDHDKVVGCVALANHGDGLYEISKMGVEEVWQNTGVGRALMLTALDKARQLNATEVYLESSTKLERALHLYKNMGFRQIPHPQGKSKYDRSDIYMILKL